MVEIEFNSHVRACKQWLCVDRLRSLVPMSPLSSLLLPHTDKQHSYFSTVVTRLVVLGNVILAWALIDVTADVLIEDI